MRRVRRMPFGAEISSTAGVRFRLWAPAVPAVTLALGTDAECTEIPMVPGGDGWFTADVRDAGAGTRYRFRLPDGLRVPDPASRFQPDGVHGASEVVDPGAFAWRDGGWRGRPLHELVVYELHVGAFTAAGTFDGVVSRLDELASLGVTAIELMPVAAGPGRRGWGYDGVYPFAPHACYGRPEDLKRLVEAAHERGLMVLLDVVYNHFGPEGNYLARYAPAFFTDRHRTPWGAAIDFEGPSSRVVRDFFVHNALYWVEEYHLDGLRLDAVHAIHDASEPDVLTEIADAVHRATPDRHVHLVLENDDNCTWYLERAAGEPRWYAAQWNDDLHHAAHVCLTGERVGYYADYGDDPVGRLGRALAEGFVYQGEPSAYRDGARRGEPSAHLPPLAFVSFLQNHDQVGNRAFGERLVSLATAPALRAATALVLLAPAPPLLFMGEDWGTAQPFPFFCDFGPELAAAVREGRRREFARFPAFEDEQARARIPDPGAPETFAAAVLRWEDAAAPAGRRWRAFHRRLLAIRQREIMPRLAGIGSQAGGYEHLGARGLRVRWRLGDGSVLGVVANLGAEALAVKPPPGDLLWVTSTAARRRLAAGSLPGWGVAWGLARALPPGESTA